MNTAINADVGTYADLGTKANRVILDAALAKRAELEGLYRKGNIPVKPLLLIQLPSETQKLSKLDRSVQEEVEKYLLENNISYDNGRLAIWLADDKRNLKQIEQPDSRVDVLIFKEAVAVGWDCPRAQILVMLRAIQSLTFEIQTVGRILRMPEAKHYADERLNSAFVYTNVPEFQIKRTADNLSYFTTQRSSIRADLKERISGLALPNFYNSRAGKYADLTGSLFPPLLKQALNEIFGISSDDSPEIKRKKVEEYLELEAKELTVPLLADVVVNNWDEQEDINQLDNHLLQVAASNGEVEHSFDRLLKLFCRPYVPSRSVSILKHALYSWFDKELGIGVNDKDEVQRIVACSPKNQRILAKAIDAAKEAFEIKSKAKSRQAAQAANLQTEGLTFRLPEEDTFGNNYEELQGVTKCAHEPCFLLKDRSLPEKAFVSLLEESDEVEWWYNNGTQQSKYLAIEYNKPGEDGHSAAFYPDFIVGFVDGTIGIYDTKNGITADSQETAEKSNALLTYIESRKNEGMTIEGGIVVVEKANTSSPTFRICTDPNYKTKSECS